MLVKFRQASPTRFLSIPSWENAEINKASIRQAAKLGAGWGGAGPGLCLAPECLRKPQGPRQPEVGGFPQPSLALLGQARSGAGSRLDSHTGPLQAVWSVLGGSGPFTAHMTGRKGSSCSSTLPFSGFPSHRGQRAGPGRRAAAGPLSALHPGHLMSRVFHYVWQVQ